jgi:hypothetical protein
LRRYGRDNCCKHVGALLSDAAKLPGIFLLAMAEDDDARWRGNRRGKPAPEKEGGKDDALDHIGPLSSDRF